MTATLSIDCSCEHTGPDPYKL